MRLETERLILREWRDEDLDPFAEMCADIEVMGWMAGGVLSRDQARQFMDGANDRLASLGRGRFAVVLKGGAVIGATGLSPSHPELAEFLPPFFDMSWCMRRDAWGQGYMTEACRAVIADGFGRLDLPEITAMTAPTNLRSQAVMARLGMVRRPELDFDNPFHPEGDPLRRSLVHVVRR